VTQKRTEQNRTEHRRENTHTFLDHFCRFSNFGLCGS
jgi:hypothetical protein